ncbi:hypothetical protein [Lentibacillus salicampi]|uniref:DUF8042 domain-containing protein n=1 Tax=Lentibacillus salicampi TaxID=175306 RepID=A0A4Y9AEN9_9BACI|nr:hypothetical protein [Lentibacillus salicampi]TFJ94293.1 hypothetical protein E4U82_03290 [Lentibacillus salicampi]
MEKYSDVMKQSSALLETVDEGLQHMQTLLKHGKYEATISLFEDIVQAFSTIEKSVLNLPEELLTDDIQSLTGKVRNALDSVVDAYEANRYGSVRELLQFTLLPVYRKWAKELNRTFTLYVVS